MATVWCIVRVLALLSMGQQFEPWRRCQINSGEDCNFKVKKKQRQKIAKPQTKTLNWKGEGIDESMPLMGRSISTFVETSSMHLSKRMYLSIYR